MQQIKTLIIYPLLLIAALYGGIKAYIYFGVKGSLDDIITRVQPVAQISYGGLSSSLDGSIEVDTIEVKTPQQPIPVRIGSLRLQGSGIGFLFDLAKGYSGGSLHLPEMLQLDLRRMELPDIQQMVRSMLPSNRGLLDLPPEPCDLGGLVRDVGMMSADTYPIYLDLNMGYQLDPQSGSSRLDFGYFVLGGESLATEVELSGIPQPGALMMGMVPAVDRITVQYQPNGEQLQARVRECAKERGVSESAYIQALLAQPDQRLAKELGFVPGKGLRLGLERFLLKPEEILVVAGPIDQPMQLGSGQIQPEQAVDFLNLRVSVNGEPLTDLSFRSAADAPAARVGEQDGGQSAAPGQTKKVRRRARYIDTPIAELGQYLGRPVHLEIVGHNEPQSGVLTAVGDGKVDVEKRIQQGKMTMHVEFENLQRIQVLRFPEKAE